MTSEEFWQRMNERRGITFTSKGRDGNCNVMDCNQTPFEVPDPEEMPDNAREDFCEYILGHLDHYKLC